MPRVGEQGRRIASPAWPFPHRNRLPAHALDDRDHLSQRMADAGAEIESGALASRQQVAEGADMRLGKVGHVDEIADGGAIGRRIVGAEDLDPGSLAERRRDDQRDQVGFRIVLLAKFPVRISARGIEVAEGDRAQVVSGVVSASGTPYVAQVEEKTMRSTPASNIASNRASVLATLL